MISSEFANKKNDSITLKLEELIILLNELYLDSRTDFKIIDSLYGRELIRIQLSDNIKIDIITNPYDINDAYKSIPAVINSEFPNKFQYFDIFVKSGFFFNNFYQKFFAEVFDKIEKTNYLEGDIPIAIAFDTNLYYNQFFNQITELLKQKSRTPIYFLLSQGVKKELTGYERKYKQDDIELMKEFAKHNSIVEDFFNQNKLNSRLWHLGHVDFLNCVDQTYTKIVGIDKTIKTDDMDSKIIEGLVQDITQQNVKLFLFSQDSDFISRAKGNRNVYPVFLDKIPLDKLEENLNCDWHRLTQLIFILAITFGGIILRFRDKSDFIIQGIWKGKKYHHWNTKSVKIKSTNMIIKNIQQDLKILENMRFKEV